MTAEEEAIGEEEAGVIAEAGEAAVVVIVAVVHPRVAANTEVVAEVLLEEVVAETSGVDEAAGTVAVIREEGK